MDVAADKLDRAIAWARSKLTVESIKVVRQSPWGATLRLSGKSGHFYLKVLPQNSGSVATALASIAAAVPAFVAEVVATDPVEGFVLSADHKGDAGSTNADPIDLILQNYAQLQSIATGQIAFLSSVGRYDPAELLARAFMFLQPPTDSGGSAHLSQFFGLRYAGLLHEALAICRKPIEKLLDTAHVLPLTLNHCDLHTGNVGFDLEGRCKFHDWDNAMVGPAGLSLSGLIGSTADLIAFRLGSPPIHSNNAKRYQNVYAEALVNAGYAQDRDLRRGLEGAILAGLLVRLVNYAPYRPESEQEREQCLGDLNRICADLLDCCQVLAEQDKTRCLSFADLLCRHQYYDKLMSLSVRTDGEWLSSGAQAGRAVLAGRGEIEQVSRLAAAYKKANEPDAVPALTTASENSLDRGLFALETDVATRIFAEQGALALLNAFPRKLLSACLSQYVSQGGGGSGTPLKVGDKRMMEALSLSGVFNNPSIYAQPLLMNVFERLLGHDFVIGSMTIVVSQPGSQAQHLHIDHPNIFGDTIEGARLPPHAITVLIPLIDIDEEVGGTEIVKGSHLVPFAVGKEMPRQSQNLPLGSCLMFDYRLFHGGLPNRSNRNRPVLSIVYHRAWFRDSTNFGRMDPLQVRQGAFEQIPEANRSMFRNALVSAPHQT